MTLSLTSNGMEVVKIKTYDQSALFNIRWFCYWCGYMIDGMKSAHCYLQQPLVSCDCTNTSMEYTHSYNQPTGHLWYIRNALQCASKWRLDKNIILFKRLIILLLAYIWLPLVCKTSCHWYIVSKIAILFWKFKFALIGQIKNVKYIQ